jgi:hypothetical protein
MQCGLGASLSRRGPCSHHRAVRGRVDKAERAGYTWIGAGPDALKRKMAQEITQSQEVLRFPGIKAE